MAQITTGIRSVLSLPKVYQFLQNAVGKDTSKVIINEYLRPKTDDTILDIGCGPAELLLKLPLGIKYIGIDLSEKYIAAAKEKHGERGVFIHGDVGSFDYQSFGSPDIVMMLGVLHHLNDDQVAAVFQNITKIKKASTRVVTLDPCFTATQGFIARRMAASDRGQNVRTPENYAKLLSPFFKEVKVSIREDLLRIPYTFCIIECN